MANKRQKKKRRSLHDNCSLCGKKLNSSDERVVGRTGQLVCSTCLRISKMIYQSSKASHDQSEQAKQPMTLISPSEMVKELNKSIIGQDQAKRSLAVTFWKQQLRAGGAELPNTGLLLYGPTGCGKTALVREAARLSGLPCIVADATSLSETGYRGRDGKDIIIDLAERFGSEKAKYGVVFLDEIDKLRTSNGNEYRAEHQRGTQHSLLKLIEGTELRIDGEPFSTSDILFIFGGAFTGIQNRADDADVKATIGFERTHTTRKAQQRELLPEDFISFGMEAELMGRIGRCVGLNGLTAEDMKRILLESELSVYRKYQKFFRNHGRELALDDAMVTELTQKASARGMGARGLNALVEDYLESQLFLLAEGA